MSLYFFMIHVFQPNVVSLCIPLYIQALSPQDAQTQANNLTTAFSNQFRILFCPNAPCLLVPSVNGPTFNALISQLQQGNTVMVSLPVNHSFILHQKQPHTNPLSALEAMSLIPGNHSMQYAL